MNSYTQALFMTKEFRFRLFTIQLKDIMKFPDKNNNTEKEEKEKQD